MPWWDLRILGAEDLRIYLRTYGASDGEIFSVIHDGVSADMDGYAARLSDSDIWNVVTYIKSLAAKR